MLQYKFSAKFEDLLTLLGFACMKDKKIRSIIRRSIKILKFNVFKVEYVNRTFLLSLPEKQNIFQLFSVCYKKEDNVESGPIH